MSKRARVAIGLVGISLLLLVAVILFVRYQIRKSFPDVVGTLSLSGLREPVDVARDDFGVPHIRARNEHDLMFALGLVHAQDRLWQMDIGRRSGEGRLSEVFGEVTVPFDRMFRIVGIRRTAEAIEQSMKPESRDRLLWYADGVNAFIATHKGAFPLEFDMLGYEPERWTPVHSIILGRMMAWRLNLSWWTDLTMGAIAERVGLEKALDVFPTYPATVPTIVPQSEWRRSLGSGVGYLKTAQSYLALLGIPSMTGGSNAWVVAPFRSATKGALLANDTHLQLELPSRWYEVHLQAPGYDVRGMSMAGIPGVVVGRNDRIAWGVTNVMADDADFYVERIDSVDSTKYLYDGRWQPITYLSEDINVRGDSAVPLTVRLTRHGPIVTDIATPLQRGHYPYVTSMRWTGAETDDQFDAFNTINRAGNWGEFIDGVRKFAVPGQNFVYGDTAGNIGYWCGVRLPLRSQRQALLPLPGWEPSSEWKGYVPFDQLPHLFNPPEGYIATANNKIVDDSYPYHISDLWEPPSRFVRLNDILSKKDEAFSIGDFERLQNDQYSVHASEIAPYILAAFADSTIGLDEGPRALEYLRNWHFVYAKDDIATAIYQMFFVTLLVNIYEDEMGPELFHDFVLLSNIPIRVTTRLLHEGTSPWFDDITTPGVETRDDIIRKSLRQALLNLREQLGADTKDWRWGSLHTVTLRHPMGMQKPLNLVFSLGPYPLGGGTTSLVSGEYDFNHPFGVTVGSSFRMICDMANPSEMRTVLPSGQSGQAFHPHYSDQTDLWLNGGYRIARTGEGGQHWDHLRLEPVR